MMAGLITDWGNFFNLIATIDSKPSIIDLRSNHNLLVKHFFDDSLPASALGKTEILEVLPNDGQRGFSWFGGH